MLQRVKTYWLVGALQESLHGAALIDLAMTYRSNAVANAVASQGMHALADWHQPDNLLPDELFDTPLPIGTAITTVYDQAEGTLLVMGEPGAGKQPCCCIWLAICC